MFKLAVTISLTFLLAACSNKTSQKLGVCNNAYDDPSNWVESLAKEKNFPGLAVAVGVKDEIIWTYGFGYADVANAAPIDPETTKFRIGSTSKALTGFALARLAQEDAFDLDMPVSHILTDLPTHYDGVTIGQLAGHIGGVRHYKDISELGNTTEYTTSRDALEIFVNDPLVASPGVNYSYSTYGYTVISAALETRFQKSFLDLMSETVFDPLGMPNTVPDRLGIESPERTQFYYLDENMDLVIGDEINSSNKWAGGGYLSPAKDLANFGLAHFDESVLGADARALLWTRQKEASGTQAPYGVGWFIEDGWVQHPGGALGGSTLLRIYPDEEVVIVLIANLSMRGENRFDDLPIQLFECFSEK